MARICSCTHGSTLAVLMKLSPILELVKAEKLHFKEKEVTCHSEIVTYLVIINYGNL